MENIKQYVFGGHTYLFVKIIKKIKKHSFSMISYSLSNRSPVTLCLTCLYLSFLPLRKKLYLFLSPTL